jgi:transposase-like protein
MSCTPECPKCHSGEVRRSRRRGFEILLPRLRAYRCEACDGRFVRFGRSAAGFTAALAVRSATTRAISQSSVLS